MSGKTPNAEVIGAVEDGQQALYDDFAAKGQEATSDDFSKIGEGSRKYAWEATVWDSFVLLGTPALGVPTSVLVALALILNIVVRVGVFSWMFNDMLEPHFSDDDVMSFKRWRTSDGHSVVYRDIVSGESLASRVCHGDRSLSIATDMKWELQMIQHYTEGDFPAEFFQILLMVLLCAVAFPELMNSLSCCVSLLVTPKGKTSVMKVGARLSLQSIGCCQLAVVLFANILRALVTIGTLYATLAIVGTTLSMVDMLIGFAGGAATFWGYEALARACVPRSVHAVMSALVPQPLNKGKQFAGVWPVSFVLLLGNVVLIVIVFVAIIQPQLDKMKEARDQLCGGNLNFVFSVNPDKNSGNVYSMASKSSTSAHDNHGHTDTGSAIRAQVMSLIMKGTDPAIFNSVNAGALWAALDMP